MFQRLSNLLFGEVEEVAAEINGPNPCVTEADEEGWMIVNLPEAECMMQVEDENPPLSVQSFPSSQLNNTDSGSRADCSIVNSNPRCKRRKTHKGRSRRTVDPTSYCSNSPSDLSFTTPETLGTGARGSLPSSPSSVSPGSQDGCGGSGGSRTGSERGCMDESWFVTPPPCFTAEGATAEASPMEDLLIEHPSMSVYVSQNGTGISSSSNLSVVGEESMASLAGSMSRVTESSAVPATCTTMPTRVSRGAAQAGSLAKVTQMSRVQRGKARMERRRLGRNHIQRQNRTREQVPRLAAHVRNSFLHQPCKRNFCH
ncbi:tumor protein p53-inducible nuclear protein 2 isoform X2 [Boleophthalmus pectinirostris]|uniref:tumor protein p53-inducible nuclear protein 2 isoform X2 n=1 Tax=Boleophthalmus pectinirostris TaxID=150288 RepID=UPI00242AA6E6|nr:tumor protein p53-inducible nuclear protein 2 isoform X2 [Boleophthalmus pectinirostris]